MRFEPLKIQNRKRGCFDLKSASSDFGGNQDFRRLRAMNAAPEIVLKIALDLAARGVPVFPCNMSNKKPLTKNGHLGASTDGVQIRCWWADHPGARIGVPTGRASKIIVIDVDPKGAGWYAEHSAELTCGRIHKTPRGHHLLYRDQEAEVRNSVSVIAPGIDVRGEGGYIIWWPAHRPGLPIGDFNEIAAAPAWVMEKLTARKTIRSTSGDASKKSDQVFAEGARNSSLASLAGTMRHSGATREAITEALLEINVNRCNPPLPDTEVMVIADSISRYPPKSTSVTKDDFFAYMPMHQYIFTPSRELWPAVSVNARVPPIIVRGLDKPIPASYWLDSHRAVEQMTWAPGEPMVIKDRLVANGGWISRPGCQCFNLYLPPTLVHGDRNGAQRWLDHVRLVYPNDADHIVMFVAQRVQRPAEKINHALVLGGLQGIGKDTLLEPVKAAIGPWNFNEVSPGHLLGRFNSFVKSVILRVSEARDLGDVDRYSFYDHMKVYTAAPPDVLRCDEKHLREHAVMNVCGVVITTNHKSDGIYLPADDRRHYVAWSNLTKDDFTPDYWTGLYRWYADGGSGHVAAYLAALDLSAFDSKAPPPKTPAFWDIVDANRAPEDAELADVLDVLGNPPALTLRDLQNSSADYDIREWLGDRRNRRQIPHRLEAAGYVPVRYEGAEHGLWTINRRRQSIYAPKLHSIKDQVIAARNLVKTQEARK
jgi:hypothetical protein